MPEPLSFFDFDNTLYRGISRYIIRDFSSYLATRKHFPPNQSEILEGLFGSYFSGTLSRHDFGVQVVDAFYRGLAGQRETDIQDQVMSFLNYQKDKLWFPYSKPILKLVQPFMRTILVSGSPMEVLEPINQVLGLNEVYASRGIIEHGLFTGETRHELATAIAKKDFMSSLLASRPFNPQKSLAFGDSESDFPLLEAVSSENAFLLTDQLKLKDFAEMRQWHFILQDGPVLKEVRDRIEILFQP